MDLRKSLFLIFGLGCLMHGTNAIAIGPSSRDFLQEMRDAVKNMLVDNEEFMKDPRYNDAFFQEESSGQHPRTTVVGCSDSRVHTVSFDLHPLGDLFFIRNIGNQIETCLGSVDYGIKHLETSSLLILGHSKCGAITAVTQGIDQLEGSIHRELKSIEVSHKSANPTNQELAENIAENIHHQVNKACTLYQDLIHNGKLWIIGAIYDFTPQGHGKLRIVQVNDKTDEASIEAFLSDVREYGVYRNDPGRVPSERE